jgi:dUTP pyrophosphatase
MVVRIKNTSPYPLPAYATEGSAGVDVRAHIDQELFLKPLDRILVGTGIYLEIPAGAECQVRPRSGLAAKHGVTVLNTPGTIDSDYRGEVKVLLINLSQEPYLVAPGERIAQLVFARYEQIQWEQVNEINETTRGAGGFGHSGKQ